MPRMIHVSSTSIAAIGYEADDKTLYIRFLESGETYVYYGVETWRHKELLKAESKGSYFNEHIKPNYRYDKF